MKFDKGNITEESTPLAFSLFEQLENDFTELENNPTIDLERLLAITSRQHARTVGVIARMELEMSSRSSETATGE